jgi:RNA polymerase sigma factor (sigma-70 family)
MSTSDPFPDMATGYERYRPVFFDALARLARQGFVIQPADADDLIQAFFADAWPGLASRYDPAAGSEAAYVYGAFVRFARQRIARARKWDLRLQDLAHVAEDLAGGAAAPPDRLIRREEWGLVETALKSLPDFRRSILVAYFARGPRSQRALAAEYGTTRYQVREWLINSFGQLVARLAVRDAWPPADREIAFYLWCAGCDLEETAARTGRPVAAVKETRERLVKRLAADLGGRPVPAARATEPGPAS